MTLEELIHKSGDSHDVELDIVDPAAVLGMMIARKVHPFLHPSAQTVDIEDCGTPWCSTTFVEAFVEALGQGFDTKSCQLHTLVDEEEKLIVEVRCVPSESPSILAFLAMCNLIPISAAVEDDGTLVFRLA